MSLDDQQGTPVTGAVTEFYPSEDETKPHGVYVDGVRYTTFQDRDVRGIETGATVQFRYEQNGDHRNIVPGSVDVVDAGDASVVFGNTGSGPAVAESPRDRHIRCTVALQEARELCQPLITEDISEARLAEVVDAVCETAETFAETLLAMNRETAEGEA